MTTSQTVLDRAAIEARLPHREPFLFLDRFEIEPAATRAEIPSAKAEWRVPEDADFFRGHYPENPVTPGVILCEHAFQAAAVLLTELGQSFGSMRGVPVLARIEKAKFRRMVRPGETLHTRVSLVETPGRAFYLEGASECAGERVLELSFALTHAVAGGEP
jgi:3-hydroxyacyl-[acyl-carrier-protein] dehydratase